VEQPFHRIINIKIAVANRKDMGDLSAEVLEYWNAGMLGKEVQSRESRNQNRDNRVKKQESRNKNREAG
jgi:hypothetical protein